MNLVEVLNLVAAVLVGGFLTFLATLLIKRVSWPSWTKLILSMIMAAVFALAMAWVNGDVWSIIHAWGSLTAQEVMVFGTLIWTTASIWYKVVFKDAAWANVLGAWPKRE